MKDFTITSLGTLTFQATNNVSITAVTGDCTVKAGAKMNLRSDQSFNMHSESANFIWACASTLSLTSGAAQTYTAGGDITMSGGPNINLN
jgi:hypothetical protein